MEIGKLYAVKLYENRTRYLGIVQVVGEEWVLLYSIFSDYMMDSYLLLKREYIESVVRDDKVMFTEEVLVAKGVNFFLPALDMPIDNTEHLLDWIKENKVTIMFSKKRDAVSYVGQISKILPGSFYLKPLGAAGCWWKKEYLYRINTVRTIQFETDYIQSLLAYNVKNASSTEKVTLK